jgi:hypothetical protein
MQQRLPLPPTAEKIARGAILTYLTNVTAHGLPTFNLPVIVCATTTTKVPAVPLKPPPRIVI